MTEIPLTRKLSLSLLSLSLSLSHTQDHNDPAKTRANWSLLPESEYEAPWFPIGECAPAVPRTAPGSVHREDLAEGQAGSGGQAFGVEQMMADAAARAAAPPATAPAPNSPSKTLPPAPASPVKTAPPAPAAAIPPTSPWRGDGVPPLSSSSAPAAAAATSEQAEMIKTIFSVLSAEEQRSVLSELASLVKQ